MERNISLIAVLVLALALSGCFGFLAKDKELESIELHADYNVIESGDSNLLTLVGKAEDGSTVAVEPTAEAWVLVTDGAGELEPDAENLTRALFTANADYIGNVIVKVEYEGLTEEVEFSVAEVNITGAKAMDFTGQDGYQDVPTEGDREGVQAMGDNRGYAEATGFTHWNNNGHSLEWELDVPVAGEYALVLRYATNVDEVDTRRLLHINGEEIFGKDNAITMEPTGGGAAGNTSQWGLKVVPGITITDAGTITLKLTHDGTKRAGTNLGYLALISPAEIHIDEDMILRIEAAIGVERMEDQW